MKSSIAVAVAASIAIAGCTTMGGPTPTIAFYVGLNEPNRIRVEGAGWEPGKPVKIWLYGEPVRENGKIISAPKPRLAKTVTPDANGNIGVYPLEYVPITPECAPLPSFIKPWATANQENSPLKTFYSDSKSLAALYGKSC